MKAKTRILAMLLTVLMVAGLLPLTLFAAAGDTPSEPSQSVATARDLESIQSTLASNELDLYIYQSFENIPNELFSNGVLALGTYRGEWVAIDSNAILERRIDFVGPDDKAGKNPFEVKNYRRAMSIKQEGDNNAIYLGNAALVGSGNDDTWFDIEPEGMSPGSDMFVSVDFKMDGETVAHAQDDNTLLTVITRFAKNIKLGRTDIKLIGLTYDGGIFLWDNNKRTEIVGYLSNTEYTRVTVETDVSNNKYYVYLNDVCVNPEGCTFITDTVYNKIKGLVADFEYIDFQFDDIRVYTLTDENRPDNYQIDKDNPTILVHDGMWIDNILLAGRSYAATPEGRFNPFAEGINGFVTAGGVTRYVENGIPKTADFTLGEETYKVGQGGAIVGKLSDGVMQSSYAPYVDWEHSGSFLVNEPDGNNFHGGSDTMTLKKYAFVKDGFFVTPDVKATLYSSFLNKTGYTGYTKSYYALRFAGKNNNANLVLDFDIKLGQKSGDTDVLMLSTRTDPNGLASGDNRGDVWYLRIRSGWLTYGKNKIVKLSDTEFTRISFALKTPDAKAEAPVFVSTGDPKYTETDRTTDVYTLEEFAALEIEAKGKVPDYNEESVAYEFKTAAKSISKVADGKRTIVHAGTGTVNGTYTEIKVEYFTENDVEKVKVTEITGTVTRKDNYERTTVYTLNGSYSIYVNGVMMVEDAPIYTNGDFGNNDASNVEFIRMFDCESNSAVYIKDYYFYEAEKPQQYYTRDGGTLAPTSTGTPVKASDIKNGFVKEDGVTRYYNELGLPMIDTEFKVGGKTYKANENGKLVCNGETHIGSSNNGICPDCGEKIDGVTSLYGHNLVLGDDVKVNFYLDIDTAKAEGAKVIVGVPGDKGRMVTLDISELETYPDGGDNCYVVSFPVPAKDIGANITAKLVKEGETFTEYSYSAQTYIDAVKVAEVGGKITQELKNLVTALDEYGKNAAAVLAGGQQMVAIDDSEVDWNTVEEASGTKAAGSVVRLNTFSLDLKSKIRLRVYFKITSGSLSDYTVTVDESEVNAIAVGGNIYCIDYAVYAKELNTTVDIEIAKGEETMLTLSMAPLYYAKIMAAKYTGDNVDAYENLMKAIKLYSDAAIAYANSQQPNE